MTTFRYTLHPNCRQWLADNIEDSQRRLLTLCGPFGTVVAMFPVAIEQCDAAIHARIECGDTVNEITLRRGANTAARLARFIEEIANGVSPSSVPEVDEDELASELEIALRQAISLGHGTHYLPVDDISLCLLLHKNSSGRTSFRIELNEQAVTLPLLLPTSRQRSYELLNACVQELLANYRSYAA